MANLDGKIKDKKKELKAAKVSERVCEVERVLSSLPVLSQFCVSQEELKKARGGAEKEKLKKKVDRLKEQYKKLKINRTDKVER